MAKEKQVEEVVEVDPLQQSREIVTDVRRKFGEDSIFLLGDSPICVDVRSSGSIGFDLALGGGWAKGRMGFLQGQEKSGKTTLACLSIAEAQVSEPDKENIIIDLEQAFNPDWAEKLGVDLNRLQVSQPATHAERVYEFIEYLLTTGKYANIVLDSADGLIPKEEFENEDWDKESRVGGASKINSKAMRKLVNSGLLRKSDTSLLIIQQLRDKIGGFSMYGTPTTTSGGRAFRHNSTQTVEVSRGDTYSKGNGQAKVTLGQQLKFKVSKNKIAPPFKLGSLDLFYETGVDKVKELVTVGKAIGVIEGTSWLKIINIITGEYLVGEDGQPLKWNGVNKLVEAINADLAKGGELYLNIDSFVQETIRG